MIELKLPWCPSINHYKRIGATRTAKSGKQYSSLRNSDQTNKFYYDVRIILLSWAVSNRKEMPLHDEIDLQIEIDMHPPDKRRTDVDSRVKVCIDSLQRGGLIKDDYQFSRLVVERKAIIKGGELRIRITPR